MPVFRLTPEFRQLQRTLRRWPGAETSTGKRSTHVSGLAIRWAIRSVWMRMRIGHLNHLGFARRRTDAYGDEEPIRNQAGKEYVLSAPVVVVGTVKDVRDITRGGADVDSEWLGRKRR